MRPDQEGLAARPLLTRVAVVWLGSQNLPCAVFIRASRSNHFIIGFFMHCTCINVAPSNSLFGPRHRHRTSGFDCPCLPSTPTWFHVCLDTARQLTVSSSQIHQNLIDQTWFFSSRTSDRPNRGACILSREAAKLKCRAPDLLNCSKPAKLRLCLVLFSKNFGNGILAFRSTK